MRVLEQMVLHFPVHVYIQACLHMARDCAAPPAHSEYNLMGGGRNPASRPSRDRSFDVAVEWSPC